MENLSNILKYAQKNFKLDFFAECEHSREVYIFDCDVDDMIKLKKEFSLNSTVKNYWDYILTDTIDFDKKEGVFIKYEREIVPHCDSFNFKNNNCKFRIEFFM